MVVHSEYFATVASAITYFGLRRAHIEHSNPDGTIGRDDVKGGLDNNGSGGGEDVVEVGEVEPAVACSALARF